MPNPDCPKCESPSTRRIQRKKSLGHRIMYLFGMFPWECVDCQKHFFSAQRHSKKERNLAGEVYYGSKPAAKVKPGSEEKHI